jgi:hypothetical protein
VFVLIDLHVSVGVLWVSHSSHCVLFATNMGKFETKDYLNERLCAPANDFSNAPVVETGLYAMAHQNELLSVEISL